MKHFCTITDTNHLFKTFALHDSLREHEHDVVLHVLMMDDGNHRSNLDSICFYSLQELISNLSKNIQAKYASKPDKLRWSLKPVFLSFLLGKFEAIVYTDNDIAFFNSSAFLFKELKTNAVLLTPHHYSFSPTENQNWLEANFKIGLYNAGFVGVNRNALKALNWWAACCLYRCERNFWRGLFDDQKYLDLFPIIEPQTKVLQHKGCNVAGWNIEVCRREKVDGEVLINGVEPIIFIHFNAFSIRMIFDGNDPLLEPYWEKYLELLRKHKPDLEEKDLYRPQTALERAKLSAWKVAGKFSG